jgi:hypothetical protein
MAIIPQPTLFSWADLEPLGDLERRQCVLDTLPDENLMQTLETPHDACSVALPDRTPRRPQPIRAFSAASWISSP